ncbi:hypothetical protein BH11PLA2_BH11PLA2_32050 [soil metagenome]
MTRTLLQFRRVSLAVVAAGSLASFNALAAQPPGKGQDIEAKKHENPLMPVPHSDKTLSLAECLAIGAEKQPAIVAAVASLKASESGYASLMKIKSIASLAAPDLPFRKQQSERGLIVANADVAKATQENRYDIIRLYYTFVYARQQDGTAYDIGTQMRVYYGVAEELSKEPGSNVNQYKLFAMKEAINEVDKLRITARTGQSMALAALKEAMGVDQSFDFIPRDTELPVMGGTVTEEQVVQLAKQRRPELAMASAGVDAFRLEVCAQNAVKYRQKVPTLASGSDLHSRLVPLPHRNGEYRPGALAPEMPGVLVGSKDDRVSRAQDIALRQDALFDKTQQLVALEATNSYFNWQAATAKMAIAKIRFENGKDIAKKSREGAANSKDQEGLIRTEALAGKAQADYIEAVYDHIKQLATLERVTAGGVKPAFPDK